MKKYLLLTEYILRKPQIISGFNVFSIVQAQIQLLYNVNNYFQMDLNGKQLN